MYPAPYFIRSFFLAVCSLFLSFGLISCDSKDSKSIPGHERGKGPKPQPKSASEAAKKSGPKKDVSSIIEKFTGGHTRIVWSEMSRDHDADAFAITSKHYLKGIDTKDGRGERRILPETGNYSRPILSTDGSIIIYTDKNVERKSGKKYYRPMIYRTDWTSGKATKLGKGYAVDCWVDPATGTEWVYAVTNIRPTKAVALEAKQLIRFPLEDPSKTELVYDDTPVGPDNIQLSRDGTRASGLFPWPHVGVFEIENGKWTAKKLLTGCWPSLAPDNSGISWIFEGAHKSAFFFSGDGTKTWTVDFGKAPHVDGNEMYHPRWSNHARYFAITGPYKKDKNSDGGVITKGGAMAQIYLGRFNETAENVEDWLQITGDYRGEAYPDVWIEGGEKANLVGSSIPAPGSGKVAAAAWPFEKSNLLLLWRDREALNSFTGPDGKKQETRFDNEAATRFGRLSELNLDGGWAVLDSESAEPVVTALQKGGDLGFEAIILPGAGGDGAIARGPLWSIGVSGGHLMVAQDATTTYRSALTLPTEGFHLVVNRQGGQFQIFINGTIVPLETAATPPNAPAIPQEAFILGGHWSGGLQHVALYAKALPPEAITQGAQAAKHLLEQAPPAPGQVKVLAKLTEASAMPTAEGIDPYTGSLIAYAYEVEKVLQGTLEEKTIVVKHWAMLGRLPVAGFPRKLGETYELTLEREADHKKYLSGERVMDDLTVFDAPIWIDVAPPRVTGASAAP